MEVHGANTASAANQQADAPGARFGGDQNLNETFDQFLLLLTTQLQNQDPLNPMDTAQFTQQLIGFANVEQQIRTNENLERLNALQSYSQLTAAVGLIGRWVEADGDQLTLSDGQGRGVYTLASEAESAEIRITDANGRLVRTVTVPSTAGRHEFVWNGLDDAGQPMEEGVYTFSVRAVDEEGTGVLAYTTTVGRVDGLETDDEGRLLLKMGDSRIPLSLITRVHDT